MTRSALTLLLLALAAALAVAPDAAFAQIFRWEDAGGDIHYSQGVDSVPFQKRRGDGAK